MRGHVAVAMIGFWLTMKLKVLAIGLCRSSTLLSGDEPPSKPMLSRTLGAASGSYSNNFTDLSPQIIVPGCFCVTTTNYLNVGGATNSPASYYRVRRVP